MQYLAKMKKRNYFDAAFTIRKAREEAVGDRLIALVFLLDFQRYGLKERMFSFNN